MKVWLYRVVMLLLASAAVIGAAAYFDARDETPVAPAASAPAAVDNPVQTPQAPPPRPASKEEELMRNMKLPQ